jgi:SagB-type dehydrogenase family enzyme
LLERGGPLIFISADIARPSRKYGARGYRYALIESGAALQSAYLAATEVGVPLRVIGGIDDRLAHEFLALPDSAVALMALIVG